MHSKLINELYKNPYSINYHLIINIYHSCNIFIKEFSYNTLINASG